MEDTQNKKSEMAPEEEESTQDKQPEKPVASIQPMSIAQLVDLCRETMEGTQNKIATPAVVEQQNGGPGKENEVPDSGQKIEQERGDRAAAADTSQSAILDKLPPLLNFPPHVEGDLPDDIGPEEGTDTIDDGATAKYDPWWTKDDDTNFQINRKQAGQQLITDFFNIIPPRVRRITSADTVILPTTHKDNNTESERSLSIGFVWQDSDESVTSQLSTESEIHRFRMKLRRQQMREGHLPLQEKITRYMPDRDPKYDL